MTFATDVICLDISRELNVSIHLDLALPVGYNEVYLLESLFEEDEKHNGQMNHAPNQNEGINFIVVDAISLLAAMQVEIYLS